MTETVPSYVMLRTRRFEALKASLGSSLTVVDAAWRTAARHALKRDGWSGMLRLALNRPADRHYAMAEGNVLRKTRRFPRLARVPFLVPFYHWRKARHAQLAERLLRDELAARPGAVALVYNGFNVPDSVLAAVAPPDRRIFIENGYFAGTIQADPLGINVDNSLPRDPAFYRGIDPGPDAPDLALNTRAPKHAVHAAQDLPKGYVFVPFQVDSDSQITRHSPWIRDMAHLHLVLRALAEEMPDQTFVIKEHPYTREPLSGRVAPHPRILFQNGRDTEDLILGARAVVTVNSTVGVEALSRDKPVIVLGDACYTIPGLTHRVGDAEMLRAALADAEGLTPDPDLSRRFLHYLATEFLTPEAGHKPGQDVHDRMRELLVRSAAQRTENRDSRRNSSSYSALRSSSLRNAPISTSRPLPDNVT